MLLLTYIYWSNSKMAPISYNYNTEYTTKWKDYVERNDVAINSTIKPCILLVKFNLSIVSQASWLRRSPHNKRVVSSSPAMDNNFSFCSSSFRSLQHEEAHANEINHEIHLANTLC